MHFVIPQSWSGLWSGAWGEGGPLSKSDCRLEQGRGRESVDFWKATKKVAQYTTNKLAC